MQQAVDIRFPKLPLAGALAFVCAAILVVGAARLGGLPASPGLSSTGVVQSRTLRFEDASDGSVKIIDAGTSQVIAIAEPGTNGFLRGSLRALMRVRKREGISFSEPYRLERWSNGQLMLTDLSEGVAIDLNAFGHTNAAVFNAFLVSGGSNS